MKLRILETLASANPASGGPLEGLLQHAIEWQKQGHSVEVATLDPPDAPYLASMPIRVHALGQTQSRNSNRIRQLVPPLRYGYTQRYTQWMKANVSKYDAVIVNGLWNYSVAGARLALKRRNVPYFVFSHGMMDPWFKKTYPIKHAAKQLSWMVNEGPLLNNARAVLFTTEEEREVCRGIFRPYRLREAIVGYGIADVQGDPSLQIEAFRRKIPALGDRRFFLYLSRIHPKKGCDILLQAFAETAALNPDIDLVVAGPDENSWRPELEAMARRAGIENRLFWPGMLSGDAKWGAFRACEALILPSHQENFGVVVAEALACGRPVLISNKVNIWREIEEKGAGFVEDDTLSGTIRLIQRFLVLSKMELEQIGSAGRKLFVSNFTIESAAATLLEVVTKEIPIHVSA